MNNDRKKDEIIRLQSQVISSITKNKLSSLYDDIWGAPSILKNDSAINKTEDINVKPPEGMPPLPDLSFFGIENNTKEPSESNANTMTAELKEEEIKEEPPEKIEDLKSELNEYIGLERVKEEVNDLINLVTIQKMRLDHGLKANELSLHMVFSGNPGTGKTMIARLMARIYKSLGILSKGHLVEVDRSGLVAGYVGQTAIKTSKTIEKAMGGVLFIDEAYALTNREGNDYGQEAVDTLLKAMEDKREDLIIIAAGYTELMNEFVHSNPGLESRFNRFLFFSDYNADELLGIFKLKCEKSGYKLDENADDILRTSLAFDSLNKEGFGNARGVRNIFERAVVAQANRLAKVEEITKETLMLLTADDIMEAERDADRDKNHKNIASDE